MNELWGRFGRWTDEEGVFLDRKELPTLLAVDDAKLGEWCRKQLYHNEGDISAFERVCFPKIAAIWTHEDSMSIGDIPAHLIHSDPYHLEMIGRVRVIMERDKTNQEVGFHISIAVIESERDRIVSALKQSIEAIELTDS